MDVKSKLQVRVNFRIINIKRVQLRDSMVSSHIIIEQQVSIVYAHIMNASDHVMR